MRNYAYRLSHRVVGITFGFPLWFLFIWSGYPSSSPDWLLNAASNGGLIVAYLESLYFQSHERLPLCRSHKDSGVGRT